MNAETSNAEPSTADTDALSLGPDRPWVTCILPFIVFLTFGMLEPNPGGGGVAGLLGIPYAAYPILYSLRMAATLAILAWTWRPTWNWLGRTTWWPFLLGLLLVVPWIVLATLQRELGWASSHIDRSSFNAFEQWGPGSAAAWGFFALRALGLVVVVPIVEELFLRGFLMRYVINEDFWTVPFGKLTLASAAACLVYAVTTHPAEALAAVCWFAGVSGLAAATRRPSDAILAHAATNLALGVYVLATDNWWLV